MLSSSFIDSLRPSSHFPLRVFAYYWLPQYSGNQTEWYRFRLVVSFGISIPLMLLESGCHGHLISFEKFTRLQIDSRDFSTFDYENICFTARANRIGLKYESTEKSRRGTIDEKFQNRIKAILLVNQNALPIYFKKYFYITLCKIHVRAFEWFWFNCIKF